MTGIRFSDRFVLGDRLAAKHKNLAHINKPKKLRVQ
jgi:hypothetical protein